MNDKELQKVVEGISKDFFDKPFLHRALFNSRLRTTGGSYLLSSHNIEVNKKYLDQLGIDELIGIIKHELCHYHLHQEGRAISIEIRILKIYLKRLVHRGIVHLFQKRQKKKRK